MITEKQFHAADKIRRILAGIANSPFGMDTPPIALRRSSSVRSEPKRFPGTSPITFAAQLPHLVLHLATRWRI